MFRAKAYQNGVECSSTVLVRSVETEKLMSNIKPGVTLEVQKAYLLADDSEIVVEVGPWIAFGDEKKVTRTFSVA